MELEKIIKDVNVVFITTKNIDYIRNTQELRILKKNSCHVDVIFSNKNNYFLRIVSVWNKIRKYNINECDVVFVGFAPQLIIPFCGKFFKNKKIVIDFFISVYDTFICDRKKFRDGGVISKICHSLDKKTLQKADCVITDTKAHAEYFINEFDGNPKLFQTIYLEADSDIYYPRPQKKPDELKDKFIVLYFGSILPLQGVNVVLDTIRELKGHEEIFFDIIGPIPKSYNKPILDNVHYTEWLSQEELAVHIANADICLAGHFNENIEKAKRTIPGKAYIYEAMCKKIILGDNRANHELFMEDSQHYFVNMGDSSELAKCILECREKNGQ